MKTTLHTILAIGAVVGTSLISVPASANLIVNGGFEETTSNYSTTVTPYGWTNQGHSDGVLAYATYAQYGMTAYEGSYFYDLGGMGATSGPINDGIYQIVGTEVGKTYELVFGLSSENFGGDTVLSVTTGGVTNLFTLHSTDHSFGGKGFTTETIDFTAVTGSTMIAFIETANASGGNNDPLIDNVSLDLQSNPVPEPATMLLFGTGIAGLAAVVRRKIN